METTKENGFTMMDRVKFRERQEKEELASIEFTKFRVWQDQEYKNIQEKRKGNNTFFWSFIGMGIISLGILGTSLDTPMFALLILVGALIIILAS
ncbi:MAG: hypothetical protein LBO09_05745 [Candidatus Peribacteria bacterium]|jgi:hypothetical protein|nr:hypothetical protein [Candidatus Peribacteria bacterium]